MEAAPTPEARLMLAVIAQAVADMWGQKDALARQSRCWLFGDRCYPVELLGIDADWFRESLRAIDDAMRSGDAIRALLEAADAPGLFESKNEA
jgi:hypothetical protein